MVLSHDDNIKMDYDSLPGSNRHNIETDQEIDDDEAVPKDDSSFIRNCPVRQLALEAKQKMEEWLNPENDNTGLGNVMIFASDVIFI